VICSEFISSLLRLSVYLAVTLSDYDCCTDVISKQTSGCHDNNNVADAGLMKSVARVTCSDVTSSETDTEGIGAVWESNESFSYRHQYSGLAGIDLCHFKIILVSNNNNNVCSTSMPLWGSSGCLRPPLIGLQESSGQIDLSPLLEQSGSSCTVSCRYS